MSAWGADWAFGLCHPLFAWNLLGRPKPRGRSGLWHRACKARDTSNTAVKHTVCGDVRRFSYRCVPLYPNILKSKLAFIRGILQTTSQSLLWYSAHLIWNSLNSKELYLVLLFRIKQDVPVYPIPIRPKLVLGPNCVDELHVKGNSCLSGANTGAVPGHSLVGQMKARSHWT